MKPFVSLAIVCWILTSVGFSQSSTNERKPLTIEAVFGAGGITGRAPENLQWSPDSTKVSFVERDDSGEHGQLWYVDASTGE